MTIPDPDAHKITLKPSQGTVRIAAVQYLLRSIDSWEEFENQVRFVMKAAGDYKPQFVMFPEIFTTQLLSFMDTSDLRRAVRNMNDYTERYLSLFSDLAQQWGVHIIGGSHPTITDGKLLNTAYLFTPEGKHFTQEKIHLTRWEKEKWRGDAGHHLRVFDTPFGRIAILICYDIEFPELSRMVCEQGVDIIFLQEVIGEHSRLAARFMNWPESSQYEFLADTIWPDYAYGKNAVYDHGHHGNAILSRFPILRWENEDISAHRFESRGLLHCEITIPGWEVSLHCICVHLGLFKRGRGQQLQAIEERIRQLVPANAPLVLSLIHISEPTRPY